MTMQISPGNAQEQCIVSQLFPNCTVLAAFAYVPFLTIDEAHSKTPSPSEFQKPVFEWYFQLVRISDGDVNQARDDVAESSQPAEAYSVDDGRLQQNYRQNPERKGEPE